MIEEHLYHEKVKLRDELNKDIQRIGFDLKRKELYDNLSLYDSMMNLPNLYDKGDFGAILNKCQAIVDSLKSSMQFAKQKPAIEIIADYENEPAPMTFPREFNLHNIYVHRGLSTAVGAAPGVGKSTFAANLVLSAAIIENQTAIVNSMEMTILQFWTKLFQIYLFKFKNEDYTFNAILGAIRDKKKYPELWKRYSDFVIEFEKKILVVSNEYLSGNQMCGLLERLSDRWGKYPDWWVIDYIQLSSPEKFTGDKRESLIETVRLLNQKSKMTNVATVLLSQINSLEKYAESAEIENGAGIGILLRRKKVKDSEEKEASVDIVIRKNRFGRTMKVNVPFHGSSGSIGVFPKA